MTCYHPIPAYQHSVNKGQVVFSLPPGFSLNRLGPFTALKLPCGQCIGCRLERSRIWAARIMYEAQYHSSCCFVTLTYRDEDLPPDGGLSLHAPTNFIKRMRKHFEFTKLRYFYSGEYGSLRNRPHYHFCLFGVHFQDATLHTVRLGIPLYRSATLESLWPYGFSTIGSLTFESAAYVARYICDKITGDPAKEHYQGRKPEFSHMSTRPGIGKEWFNEYHGDVYSYDQMVIRSGVVCRPPRYFDKLFGSLYPDRMDQIKEQRASKVIESSEDSQERLNTKESILLRKIKTLTRVLDYMYD